MKEVLAWTLRFTEAMLPTMSNPVKLRIKALRAIVHEVLDGSAGLLLKPMQNFTFLVQGPWPVFGSGQFGCVSNLASSDSASTALNKKGEAPFQQQPT